jgi:hypothetical protein
MSAWSLLLVEAGLGGPLLKLLGRFEPQFPEVLVGRQGSPALPCSTQPSLRSRVNDVASSISEEVPRWAAQRAEFVLCLMLARSYKGKLLTIHVAHSRALLTRKKGDLSAARGFALTLTFGILPRANKQRADCTSSDGSGVPNIKRSWCAGPWR